MKHDFKEELTKLSAQLAARETQLNVASQLTSIDVYVGDNHLRIVCRVDLVDTIMENIMLKIRIPGETVICHESINLDSCYTDYTKYPLCNNGRQVNYQLQKAFGLRWMYRCKTRNHYIQTTSLPFAAAFSERHGGVISKYLTRL